jgi:ParB family chromosome partitioning protein
MSNKKEALGQGIRALLRDMDSGDAAQRPQATAPMQGVHEIPLTAIEVNPFQPRAVFEPSALQELADSIGVHGVIQPITVRQLGPGRYQLISGERRLRASRMAGLERIPAYVRKANDQEMLEIGLIENIQREDLNPMEIAINYQRLIDECGLTHDDMAKRVGKDRSTVSNYLRLLKLAPEIQDALRRQELSMGHARALLGLEDPVAQLDLFRRTIKEGWSVRKVEQQTAAYKPGKKSTARKSASGEALPPALRQLRDELRSHLGARVELQRGSGGKGSLHIPYASEEDLYRIAELLR